MISAEADDSPLTSTPLGSFPGHRRSRPKSLSLPVSSQACPPLPHTVHRISFLGVAQCFGSLERAALECKDAALGCATDAVYVCGILALCYAKLAKYN